MPTRESSQPKNRVEAPQPIQPQEVELSTAEKNKLSVERINLQQEITEHEKQIAYSVELINQKNSELEAVSKEAWFTGWVKGSKQERVAKLEDEIALLKRNAEPHRNHVRVLKMKLSQVNKRLAPAEEVTQKIDIVKLHQERAADEDAKKKIIKTDLQVAGEFVSAPARVVKELGQDLKAGVNGYGESIMKSDALNQELAEMKEETAAQEKANEVLNMMGAWVENSPFANLPRDAALEMSGADEIGAWMDKAEAYLAQPEVIKQIKSQKYSNLKRLKAAMAEYKRLAKQQAGRAAATEVEKQKTAMTSELLDLEPEATDDTKFMAPQVRGVRSQETPSVGFGSGMPEGQQRSGGLKWEGAAPMSKAETMSEAQVEKQYKRLIDAAHQFAYKLEAASLEGPLSEEMLAAYEEGARKINDEFDRIDLSKRYGDSMVIDDDGRMVGNAKNISAGQYTELNNEAEEAVREVRRAMAELRRAQSPEQKGAEAFKSKAQEERRIAMELLALQSEYATDMDKLREFGDELTDQQMRLTDLEDQLSDMDTSVAGYVEIARLVNETRGTLREVKQAHDQNLMRLSKQEKKPDTGRLVEDFMGSVKFKNEKLANTLSELDALSLQELVGADFAPLNGRVLEIQDELHGINFTGHLDNQPAYKAQQEALNASRKQLAALEKRRSEANEMRELGAVQGEYSRLMMDLTEKFGSSHLLREAMTNKGYREAWLSVEDKKTRKDIEQEFARLEELAKKMKVTLPEAADEGPELSLVDDGAEIELPQVKKYEPSYSKQEVDDALRALEWADQRIGNDNNESKVEDDAEHALKNDMADIKAIVENLRASDTDALWHLNNERGLFEQAKASAKKLKYADFESIEKEVEESLWAKEVELSNAEIDGNSEEYKLVWERLGERSNEIWQKVYDRLKKLEEQSPDEYQKFLETTGAGNSYLAAVKYVEILADVTLNDRFINKLSELTEPLDMASVRGENGTELKEEMSDFVVGKRQANQAKSNVVSLEGKKQARQSQAQAEVNAQPQQGFRVKRGKKRR